MGKSKRFRQFVAEDYYNDFDEDEQTRRSKRLKKNKYRRSRYDDDYDDEDYY
jgi:hypothetical protein